MTQRDTSNTPVALELFGCSVRFNQAATPRRTIEYWNPVRSGLVELRSTRITTGPKTHPTIDILWTHDHQPWQSRVRRRSHRSRVSSRRSGLVNRARRTLSFR